VRIPNTCFWEDFLAQPKCSGAALPKLNWQRIDETHRAAGKSSGALLCFVIMMPSLLPYATSVPSGRKINRCRTHVMRTIPDATKTDAERRAQHRGTESRPRNKHKKEPPPRATRPRSTCACPFSPCPAVQKPMDAFHPQRFAFYQLSIQLTTHNPPSPQIRDATRVDSRTVIRRVARAPGGAIELEATTWQRRAGHS
jgi:hypothetical protein